MFTGRCCVCGSRALAGPAKTTLSWQHHCLLRQVHGLLVGKDDEASGAMRAICSHLHVFRSWSAMEDVKRR